MTSIPSNSNSFMAAQDGAKELNSFCAQQMVDIMLSTSTDDEDGFFGSGFGGEIFSTFLSEALGRALVEGGSFKSMENTLVQDLTHVQMVEGEI
ncbi:MAG: hypothetical protein GY915_08580 [bacterium]|nr:hypothetical protein [bacterium]